MKVVLPLITSVSAPVSASIASSTVVPSIASTKAIAAPLTVSVEKTLKKEIAN